MAATGGEKLRSSGTGDTALGHSLPEPPVLQPAQLTCQVGQVAHGAGTLAVHCHGSYSVQCSAGSLEEAVSASQGCSRVTELS